MIIKLSSLFALIGLCLWLTSCGQKGDLVRPVPQETSSTQSDHEPQGQKK